MDSYQKARNLLNDAIAVHGGKEKIQSIHSIEISWKGKRVWRNQSASPNPPFTSTHEERRIIIDMNKDRVIQEMFGEYVGGGIYEARGVKNKDNYFLLSMEDSIAFHQDRFGLSNFERLFRLSPSLILKKAIEQTETVRVLGEESVSGNSYAVLSFVWDNKPVTIYIDKKSKRLYKLQRIVSDPTTGDTTIDEIFKGYEEKQGFLVPRQRNKKIGSVTVLDFDEVRTSINHQIDSTLFNLPSYYRPYVPPSRSAEARINKIDSKLYLYEDPLSGYNNLFADFGEYIFVFEAPLSSTVMESRIDLIKEKFPNKPIKYIGLTHFHSDHSGGIRPFISEGATIITTQNNKQFFERMVSSPFTLKPDQLSKNPDKPEFKFVDGKFELKTGVNEVHILQLPPYGHADEMLVAYFPNSGFLFTGDLVHITYDGQLDIQNSGAPDKLLEFINDTGIRPEFIGTVHGGIAPYSEMEEEIKN